MKVVIITCCKNLDQLYGSTLIFKTLRTGFPTAEVFVNDNGSLHRASMEIRQCAEDVDATYYYFSNTPHYQAIEYLIKYGQSDGPLIILDPDLVFWENCEKWKFDTLLAGRFIPKFFDPFTRCVTKQRIHTSFLWIQNPPALTDSIHLTEAHFPECDLFKPYMYMVNGVWTRLDTMAGLYQVVSSVRFKEEHLNCYDHLFCGTDHLEKISKSLPHDYRDALTWAHYEAKAGKLEGLRGLWKLQDVFFNYQKVRG